MQFVTVNMKKQLYSDNIVCKSSCFFLPWGFAFSQTMLSLWSGKCDSLNGTRWKNAKMLKICNATNVKLSYATTFSCITGHNLLKLQGFYSLIICVLKRNQITIAVTCKTFANCEFGNAAYWEKYLKLQNPVSRVSSLPWFPGKQWTAAATRPLFCRFG